ncbi:MAG: hypothetical protein ACO1SV_12860 [Fimbriimonas sp.]
MTALRWFLVLPAALIGGLLLACPAHLLLFVVGEATHTVKRLAFIDRAAVDFAFALGFVYLGARTAPRHKQGAGVFLAIFLTVANLGARIAGEFMLPRIERLDNWDPVAISMALAGALLGVLGAQRLAEPKPRRSSKPRSKRAGPSPKSAKKPARSR